MADAALKGLPSKREHHCHEFLALILICMRDGYTQPQLADAV